MTNSIRAHEVTSDLKTIVTSVVSMGAKSPEEALVLLERLDRIGIESSVTEAGDLFIRYWTIGAQGFVNPEHAAVIRSKRPPLEQTDKLDWLSKNLANIRRQYGGQWVAIYGNQVVAASPNLPDLINQVTEFDRPLVTFIPQEPVVWTFTYANQGL
jgi:hypothetical protein